MGADINEDKIGGLKQNIFPSTNLVSIASSSETRRRGGWNSRATSPPRSLAAMSSFTAVGTPPDEDGSGSGVMCSVSPT